MRTTLTLEPDVADRLRAEAEMGKHSFKQIVNRALRQGLGLSAEKPTSSFQVIPHSSGFLPGIDPEKLNQWVDESEAAEFIGRHVRK